MSSDFHLGGDAIFLMLLKRVKTREFTDVESKICQNAEEHIDKCPQCKRIFESAASLKSDIDDGTFFGKLDRYLEKTEEAKLQDNTGFDELFDDDMDDIDINEAFSDNQPRALHWLLYESAIVNDMPSGLISRLQRYAMGQTNAAPLSSALGIVNGVKNFCLNLNANVSSKLRSVFLGASPPPFLVTRGSSSSNEVNLVIDGNDRQSGKIQLDQDTRKIIFEIEECCAGGREDDDPISVAILDKDSRPVSWITLNRDDEDKWRGVGDFSSLGKGETYQYMIF
jgi:hypothetical protein